MMINLHENVADPAGVEPAPPSHQSDSYPTEQPRPVERRRDEEQ